MASKPSVSADVETLAFTSAAMPNLYWHMGQRHLSQHRSWRDVRAGVTEPLNRAEVTGMGQWPQRPS
jgi:hypothetical protein